MPCRSCQDRARIIAEARRKGGVAGLVKVMGKVGRHLASNPPKLIRKTDAGSQQPEA